MAKATKSKNSLSTHKLAGKKVALVGKFGYRDMQRARYENQIARNGGTVVDAAAFVPDYLFVGEGRGGKPPGEVAKLQKKAPSIEVLSQPDFIALLLPERDELMLEIAKGRRENHDRFWEELEQLCREANTEIDMRKADLRKVDLFGAHLEGVSLSGSDLRGANVEYTQFGDLEQINFNGCQGKNVYLRNLKACTFRDADLENAWMFYGRHYSGVAMKVETCDFRAAKMNAARMERGILSDCRFVEADLSDAEMEGSVFKQVDFTKANLSRVHASEANFDGSTFSESNLQRADLRNASLRGVDLRNANLRAAVLSGTDLADARLDGADFQDAVLTGVNLNGLDLTKAKNLRAPVARVAGTHLKEFAAAAKGPKLFSTKARVDLGKEEFALLSVHVSGPHISAYSVYQRDGNEARDMLAAKTFEEGMFALADRWPKGTLRLDSIEAKGSKTVRGSKLQALAMAAWAETFGVPVSPEELAAQRESQQADALRERDTLMKKIRAQGAKIWNDMDYRLRNRIDLRGADLSGATLDKVTMWGCNLKGANLAKASLVEGELWNAELPNAVFTAANLQQCQLQNSVLNGASFKDADLSGADLTNTKLLGADFTGATLTNTNFSQSQFDHTTLFPTGFKPPIDMVWKGDGPRPGTKKIKAAKAGSLDFDAFLAQLNQKVERERMQKAAAMLKKERFQLFAEAKDGSLVGIVKSQSDKDLVYSCQLTSAGSFGCCTQNLRPCGGLRGALCKHLLVLIVGLAKAGHLDAATVDHWINLSRGHKPAIDEESMSATFLRYKGAEAGEVDWRPTETIPEDFYAM